MSVVKGVTKQTGLKAICNWVIYTATQVKHGSDCSQPAGLQG